jgi:hypothetical protein
MITRHNVCRTEIFNEDIKDYNLQQTTPYYRLQNRYTMELALLEDL